MLKPGACIFVLFLFFGVMTRGELLYHSLMFALGGMKIHGRKGVLTDADKDQIARTVIERLRQYGDRWRLDEEVVVEHRSPPAY